MTRQPLPLPDAWTAYCRALIAADHYEAMVRDGRVHPTVGVTRLAEYVAEIAHWRDAVQACRKREQECEGR